MVAVTNYVTSWNIAVIRRRLECCPCWCIAWHVRHHNSDWGCGYHDRNIRKGSDNGQVDIGEAGNNRALRTKWGRFCTPMWRLVVCEAVTLPSLVFRGG